jgi:hypothetical protein
VAIHFLFEPGEDMRFEGIRIEDVRIHGEGQREFIRLRPVVNQYMRKRTLGTIASIDFENVTLTGDPGEYLFLSIDVLKLVIFNDHCGDNVFGNH